MNFKAKILITIFLIVAGYSWQLNAQSPTEGSTQTDSPRVILRSMPNHLLTEAKVGEMLRRFNFYCSDAFSWIRPYANPAGTGCPNDFQMRADSLLVRDHTTQLRWQREGSRYRMSLKQAQAYVDSLNRVAFAGYRHWQLPTLEQLMSLMEPDTAGMLYIDPVFGQDQWWIWTADKQPDGDYYWTVNFNSGNCRAYFHKDAFFVRAVLSTE